MTVFESNTMYMLTSKYINLQEDSSFQPYAECHRIPKAWIRRYGYIARGRRTNKQQRYEGNESSGQ